MTDYRALNNQISQFKRRLTILKKKEDWQAIITLWSEFEDWCNDHIWPDNWRLWERAAQDARARIIRSDWP